MENFKFSLTKRGKSKCPECGRFTFVQYVDSYGVSLHTTVGKCDRSDNCGHHYTPKQYFADNRITFDKTPVVRSDNHNNRLTTPLPFPSYIDAELMKRSLTGYAHNHLVQYLIGLVGHETAMTAVAKYNVGTSRNGGACFWQVDLQGRIRTGKIIVYGTDGHRRKDVYPPVGWVHRTMKLPNFNLKQCLFGEHLLRDITKMVAVVESEKTAIIASCYLPDFIWLAAGGSQGLNTDKCATLKGRNAVLYPDAGQYDKWTEKAKELSKICNVTVSDLIEKKATAEEREKGYDLADYLIRFHPSDFKTNDALAPICPRLTSLDHEPVIAPIQAPLPSPQPATQINIPAGVTAAFISEEGRIYIPTRRQTFAVYQSAEHLMSPLCLPSTAPLNEVDTSKMKKILINYN